jgi:hypothetical protein
MTRDPGRMRAAMATLLVAAALLFGVGTLVERGTGPAESPHLEATEAPTAQSPAQHVEGSDEDGEKSEASHAAEASAAAGEAGEPAGTHTEAVRNESILGIDPEAPPLVALAILVSLVAAFFVWRDGRRIVVAAAVVVAIGFATLDLVEVGHQAHEGTAVVAIIAGLVAVGHLVAAAFGVAILRRQTTA